MPSADPLKPIQLPGPIVFFGTPDFAIPTLEALCAEALEPVLVVTQPARAVGRGRRLVPPPVARRARELGLPVRMIDSVKESEFQHQIAELEVWVGLVVAFGQIFPESLLTIPDAGCINLHASLLPQYRGAAPIQAAIANGDSQTGVSTMRMTTGLDSGPILLQEVLTIGSQETTPELAVRLARGGAKLVIRTLRELAAGTLSPREQDESAMSLAPKLSRRDGDLDWTWPAQKIVNRWRAFTPWPGVAGRFRDQLIKVRGCRLSEGTAGGALPGTILDVGVELRVACGEDTVLVLERLQRPHRAALDAAAFVNGEHVRVGERFESGERARGDST